MAKVTLRGGSQDEPIALCLTIGGSQACSPSRAQTPMNPSLLASVELDGEWYMFGVEPIGRPHLILVPWSAGMSPSIDPLTVITQRENGDGPLRWWYAKIPVGIDSVTSAAKADAIVRSAQMLEAFRRWSS